MGISQLQGIVLKNKSCEVKIKQSEGVAARWCDSLILQSEQLGRVGSIPGKAPPREHDDMGSRTRLALRYLCDPSAWR